jgi:hypothetical protein
MTKDRFSYQDTSRGAIHGRKTAAGRRHRRPAAPLYNHSVMKSVRVKIGQCVRVSCLGPSSQTVLLPFALWGASLSCDLQLHHFVLGPRLGKSARGTAAAAVTNFNQTASTG